MTQSTTTIVHRAFSLPLRLMIGAIITVCAFGQDSQRLPTWTRVVNIAPFGDYHLTFVGTDPAQGSATTTVTVPIIPLVITTHSTKTPGLTYVNDATKRINGAPQGSALSAVLATVTSPLFQKTSYVTGGVNVGITQYGDAIQRAEFWDSVSTVAPDYHVLLVPQIMPSIHIDVPMADGYPGSFPNGPIFAVLKLSYLYPIIEQAVAKYPRQQFPIFLGYNVTDCNDDYTSCKEGFHSWNGQAFAFASYFDFNSTLQCGMNGCTGANLGDVSIISHEIAEWLNDPYLDNTVPCWIFPYDPTLSSKVLETGDAVVDSPAPTFSMSTFGRNYHVQDEVFASWFERKSPSTAVNGYYTFSNQLSTVPQSCSAP